MNDETAAGQPEGEALPEQEVQVCSGYLVACDAERMSRARSVVDAWYATHFHAAALAGRAPITAEDKASLIQHVTEALTPKE